MTSRILQIALPFVWFGAVGAISFMEAPLKFTAPNITLPLGLGIGYIVFHTLNKIEIVFCLLLALTFFTARPKGKVVPISYGTIALILVLQTFWLFPLLDVRTFEVINGNAPPYSNLHIVYIVFDSIKFLLLFSLGTILLRQNIRIEQKRV